MTQTKLLLLYLRMKKRNSNLLLYISIISFALTWITFYLFMYLEEIRLTRIAKSLPIPMFDYWYYYQPYNYLFGVNLAFGMLAFVCLLIYLEKNLPTFAEIYNKLILSLKNDKRTRYTFIYIFIFMIICLFIYIHRYI